MIRIADFFESGMQRRLPGRFDWKTLRPYAVLIAAVLAAYANVYGNAFLFDDNVLILDNRYLQQPHFVWSIFLASAGGGAGSVNDFYRPLQILLYLLVYKIAGFSTVAFHIPNVALHAANTCLVYAFGRRLKFNRNAVFLAALLWGLHPIHTEAVTYISATADPLYALFCLAGMLVLLPDFSSSRAAVACVFMILALLSKETAAVFPLLAMACRFLTSRERLDPKTYICILPFWFIDAFYITLRFTLLDFQTMDAGFATVPILAAYASHLSFRIYTTLATLPNYLCLLIYPASLHIERNFPLYTSFWQEDVVCGFLMVLAACAQMIRGKGKRGLAVSWGFLWFAAAQSVHTGIAVPLNAFFLEHWMYLPTVGLALGLAQSIALSLEGKEKEIYRRIAFAAFLLLAGIYATATYAQNRVWRDAPSLYGNILKYNLSIRAYNNLGKYYMDQGDYPRALENYQAALKLEDHTPDIHQNIAALLTKQRGWQKHPQDVIAELERALALDPNFLPAYDGLAYVYTVTGDRNKQAYYAARAEELRRKLTP